MGEGVISRFGYAEIDDSKSMLFDGEGFVAGRPAGDRVDGYVFAYGHDYRGAIKALYQVSGQQPAEKRIDRLFFMPFVFSSVAPLKQ